jgi:hypothetical protein
VVVLSTCLTHTAAFVVQALREVLSLPLFRSIHTLTWWSDGGPHFRNRQLLAALSHSELILGRKLDTQLNFLEPHHGKNICDSVFGHLSQLLRTHLPRSGIHTFPQLLSYFRSVSKIPRTTSPTPAMSYTFLEYVLSPLLLFQIRSFVLP